MSLTLDFTNMMAGAIKDGITDAEWAEGQAAFEKAHAAVEEMRKKDTLGFFALPTDNALLEQSLAVAESVRGTIDDVLLLGIGGSALGPIALRTALRPPGWNMLSTEQRDGYPRLHVLDNVDPDSIEAIQRRLNFPRTLVLVVSKSGGTVETMAQYLIVRDALDKAVGAEQARKQIVLVTDPEGGALRKIARAEGITAVDIPSNVGGRFSVLTPVGVLPAALMGVDVRAMLSGAAHIIERGANTELAQNIAGTFAVMQWLADTKHGRHIHVLMPYADGLRDLASWFVQLWAESLGKIRADGTHTGPTPVPALGATDQHAQVQLFMEGPADKTVTFVAVKGREERGSIPGRHGDISELAYIGGHTLGELIDVEHRATAGALAARGRFNATLHVDAVDAWHMGALMQCFGLATAYAGSLYGVDAFNQPGVELGKQYAYGMLGRPGFESAKAEFEALASPNPKYRA
ncbi:MAG: glucose-6-phosphate isomerase [Phycisphaerae bacterium]|nr:glucose-6-phosphate isomerase [Gemmatimonadaceae bacterium]